MNDPLESAPRLPVRALQRDLLAWYAARARDLPWRRERTVYGTWISEIMLQQTTVQAVVPYWQRFLARFPDVRALAAAEPEEVLTLWSGLGYYRRARQLHAAARHMVETRHGNLPDDFAGWSDLPGVGPYTAGAVASLALGEAVPAIDANSRRVHLRWSAASTAQRDALTPRRLDAVARGLIPDDRPGAWNEAVMELGALVCRARSADCGVCPVRSHCRAHAAGIVEQVPAPRTAPAAVPARLAVLLLRDADRILMLPPGARPAAAQRVRLRRERDDFATLHRGFWSLPMTPWFAAPAAEGPPLPFAVWEPWPGDAPWPRLAGAFRHGITRYRLTVEVHVAELPAQPAGSPAFQEQQGRFVAIPVRDVPVSRLTAKALDLAARLNGF